jgi:hypothetical protein
MACGGGVILHSYVALQVDARERGERWRMGERERRSLNT